MFISYQYDSKGFINVSVRSNNAPICNNQLLFQEAEAPDILGRLYDVTEKKAYAIQRDAEGQPIFDGNGDYVINEEVEEIDVSNALTGEN